VRMSTVGRIGSETQLTKMASITLKMTSASCRLMISSYGISSVSLLSVTLKSMFRCFIFGFQTGREIIKINHDLMTRIEEYTKYKNVENSYWNFLTGRWLVEGRFQWRTVHLLSTETLDCPVI
jgi:Sec7-like guanine-nucleotide exchange factor